MKEKTLTQIMEIAIAIKKPIRVKRSNGQIVMFAPRIDTEDGCYEINKDILSFVENETLYVIPYFRAVEETLKANGFVRKGIYVPFSNCDYPMDYKEKWDNLLIQAGKQNTADFISDCERISDECGYKPISEALLATCLEIPISGVKAVHPLWTKTYYPEITGETLNCVTTEKLGKYNVHNDICVFVYRNSKTYVTRNWDVVHALRENGYKQKRLIVPFSNSGEVILDNEFAQKWKKAMLL